MTDETELAPETGTRPLLLVALVLLTFLGLSAASLALPHDPYIRYQQLADTLHEPAISSYERLHFDDTPIDIALIGNSRLNSGVIDSLLGSELEARLGRPVNVVNLSLPQEGRNAHYALANELVESHPEIRLIILSAIEQMPREGHPAFRSIADAGDAVRAPVLVNRSYLDDLAFQPFRQISLFVQTQLPETFGVHRDYTAPPPAAGEQPDPTTDIPPWELAEGGSRQPQTEDQIRTAARARVWGINDTLLPEWGADFEFADERAYTRRIADLAEANGTKLAFLYLPIFENPEPLRQEGFYTDLGSVFSATFISDQFPMYRDYGHLNGEGSQTLTRWLAGQLVESGTFPAEQGEGE